MDEHCRSLVGLAHYSTFELPRPLLSRRRRRRVGSDTDDDDAMRLDDTIQRLRSQAARQLVGQSVKECVLSKLLCWLLCSHAVTDTARCRAIGVVAFAASFIIETQQEAG